MCGTDVWENQAVFDTCSGSCPGDCQISGIDRLL